VQNSAVVRRKARGFNQKSLKTAIFEDFNVQFAASVAAAMTKIAPNVPVRIAGIAYDEWP
jgi:hypothetical protein